MAPIAIIDYGMGNLRSVQKAIEKLGGTTIITNSPLKIITASAVILPGVGAFKDAMAQLKKLQLDTIIHRVIESGKPFLGICLGMQLLFNKSYEYGECEGLNILYGDVRKFPETLKIPHIGWNTIQSTEYGTRIPLLEGIPDNSYFYFVHSYYVNPEDDSVIMAMTDYGIKFTSMVCKENVYGCQFHPEKSQTMGLRLLENFVNVHL
ncbi:MAG: imidazole glycerol phosphate synthase subunit HisH [bacterium]|nr:imidazole glycerol phosphate synthase subunit HisH [bacterium]